MKGLILALCLLLTSCALVPGQSLESALYEARPAVVRIEDDSSVCSAFHIGDGRFLSAAHCHQSGTFTLTDSAGRNHVARAIRLDVDADLMLLECLSFSGPKLEIWSDFWNGELLPGSPVAVLGHPGYWNTDYTFEYSVFKGYLQIEGKPEFVTAMSAAYPGESGGPIINVRTGRVIGVTHALWMFYNTSLTAFISHHEIDSFLD